MRDTAYKSLLDRAKLRGSVLPKLSRPKLARTLNDCLHVFTSDALVLIRDEKVAAAHWGSLRITRCFPRTSCWKCSRQSWTAVSLANQFETGYWDHTLTSAIWTLPGQKEELLRTYQQELAARGKNRRGKPADSPAVQFLTSDIGVSSAKVIALWREWKTPIHIGSCVAVDHRCWAKVEDFDKSLDQLLPSSKILSGSCKAAERLPGLSGQRHDSGVQKLNLPKRQRWRPSTSLR